MVSTRLTTPEPVCLKHSMQLAGAFWTVSWALAMAADRAVNAAITFSGPRDRLPAGPEPGYRAV